MDNIKRKRVVLQSTSGFTLIELLVVLFIICLVSVTFVFTTNQTGTAREVYTFSELLRDQMEVAKEEAILKGSILALIISNTNYQFYQYNESNSGDTWLPLKLHDLFWEVYKIPANISLRLDSPLSDEADIKLNAGREIPLIIFYASGELSPFQLLISSKKGKSALEIVGHSNGNLFLLSPSNE